MIEHISFLGTAWAQQGPAPQGGGAGGFLVFTLIFFGVMYFMMIRPQMKRAREHRELVRSLKKGDEVVINGAFLGKVCELGENYLLLELSKGVEVRVQKQAVSAVLPKGSLKTL